MQKFAGTIAAVQSTAEPCLSHRERKKQATRRALHDAAFELADRHGLAHTTVEAISDRAGVAPRTFWSYFSSKEDAVINRDPDHPDRLRQALLGRPADEDAATALRRVLEQDLADRVQDSSRALRRQRLIRREPHLMAATAAAFDEIERALVAAVAERLGVDPESDLLPGVLVSAAGGACRVAQQHWVDGGGRRAFPDLVGEAFARMAEGLSPAADPGRARAGRTDETDNQEGSGR